MAPTVERARGARAVAAAVVLAAVALASGCSPGASETPSARALTAEESQLLAVARFKNFDAGTRSFSVSLQDAGHDLALSGWFDYESQVGYATLSDAGTPNSLLTWHEHSLFVHEPSGTEAPLPPPGVTDSPDASWRAGPIDPTASTLHAALIFVAELGSTRPENPLLLQQGGALWLRDETVNGVSVTVFAGPQGLATESDAATAEPDGTSSRIRYWVDAAGLLQRVEVLFGAAWVTIDLGPSDGVALDWALPEPTA